MKDFVIPDYVKGKPVKFISSYAFRNCEINQVTLSDNIRQISSDDFAYSKIPQVILSKVEIISARAFSHSGITSINIPNSVTEIDYDSKLLGGDPFECCSVLTAINVDNANKNFSSENGILYSKDKSTILRYPQKHPTTSFIIPKSVTSIGDYAFQNCSKLTSLIISNSVTGKVGENAIDSCSGLKDLFIYVTKGVLNLNLAGIDLKYYDGGGFLNRKCFVHVPAGLYDEYKKIEPFSNHAIVSDNILITYFDYSSVKTSVTPTCVTLKAKYAESDLHIAEKGVEG